MIVRMLGSGAMALVMGPEQRDIDCSWLLFGPTDETVVESAVEDDGPALRWAAE